MGNQERSLGWWEKRGASGAFESVKSWKEIDAIAKGMLGRLKAALRARRINRLGPRRHHGGGPA
jgi:hypothetical protein